VFKQAVCQWINTQNAKIFPRIVRKSHKPFNDRCCRGDAFDFLQNGEERIVHHPTRLKICPTRNNIHARLKRGCRASVCYLNREIDRDTQSDAQDVYRSKDLVSQRIPDDMLKEKPHLFLPYSPPVAAASRELCSVRRNLSSVIFRPSRSVT